MTALRTPLPTAVLALLCAVAGAAAGAAVAAAVAAGGPAGAAAPAAVALVAACAVWPWAALPVAVVGGTAGAGALGLDSVTEVTVLYIVLLGLGVLGAATRRALDAARPARVRTVADVPMAVLAAGVGLVAVYGLAAGNQAHDVAVVLYRLGIVPATFFATTLTITSRRHLAAAAALLAAGAALVAAVELATPGRHGGLLSALVLPVAVVAVVRARGATRALALAAAGLLALDVVLAAYRAMWLAAGLALLVLIVRGGPRLRAGAAAVLVAGALVAVPSLTLVPGVSERSEAVARYVDEPSGYRLPETEIGWRAFLRAPVAGHGLGHVVADQPVAGVGTIDVGPTYHAFYITLLANAGLAGAALLAWPLAVALRRRPGDDTASMAARALLWGFLAAAAFAAPTGGHWELGLLAAVAALPRERAGRSPAR